MKVKKQLAFEIIKSKNKFFGGAFLKNSHAKEKRPITTKRSMHVVLRSTLAKGSLSLLKKEAAIKNIVNRQGKIHGVKVYRHANGGNHIHLIVLPRSREAFHGFIRSISGIIARLILSAQKGSARKIQFWDKRPFSRVIEWGKEFKTVSRYLLQNTLEAYGFIPFRPRNNRYKGIISTG